MADPLTKHAYFGDFAAVYEVIRTVLVVQQDHLYRIEVMKSYANSTPSYTAYGWIERDNMWVRYALPAIMEYSAKKALEEALIALGAPTSERP